jgi:glycine/sarcosine N-methyltransferase
VEAREFYDGLGADYDLMVSWEERLAREEGFLREELAACGARRVLDAGCGTGMHAVAFARWGMEVCAADLSPAMAEKAAENARRSGAAVEVRTAGFGALRAAFGGEFDAVTCLGNTLPHMHDDPALDAALSDMARLLRPGGVLLVQNRNYDRVLRERQRFMPVTARRTGDGEVLFLRITDFPGGDAVSFTILTLRNRGGQWGISAQETPLRAITRGTLESSLGRAGFSAVRLFGSYRREPFDAPGTADLIAVAVR